MCCEKQKPPLRSQEVELSTAAFLTVQILKTTETSFWELEITMKMDSEANIDSL